MLFSLSSIKVALRLILLVCSAAVLGYALESFVDVWSSVLVLWRFWGDGSCEAAAAMMRREKHASFGISLSVRTYIFYYKRISHRHKILPKLQCDCSSHACKVQHCQAQALCIAARLQLRCICLACFCVAAFAYPAIRLQTGKASCTVAIHWDQRGSGQSYLEPKP